MKPTVRFCLLVTGSVVLNLSGCSDARSPILTEEGISWELAELRSAALADVRYDYVITVPRERQSALEGSVAVDFAWADSEPTDVILDFKDPLDRVSAVRANGSPVDWEAINDHVVVAGEVLGANARNRIEVDFIAGDEALNRNDAFLYTLFVPDRAHFSLPLFDQPNLKARFSLTLTVPEGWVAVANGEESARTETSAPPAARCSIMCSTKGALMSPGKRGYVWVSAQTRMAWEAPWSAGPTVPGRPLHAVVGNKLCQQPG